MKTCLVVDDSPTVRRVLRRMLEPLPFVLSEAGDGREALDLCREALPDAILLDWNMPVMDGLAFLTALRRLPDGSRPVVIFCTTVNELAHIEQALDAGADEYGMKPFDEEIIRAKFRQTGLM